MRRILPLTLMFVVLTVLLLIFRGSLEQAGLDIPFVFIANTLLFILNIITLRIQLRYIKSSNPHQFVRSVYSSVVMKMLLILAALFIFIVAMGGEINKQAIFVAMGIYVLYSSIEVFQLMKLVRKK